MLTQVVTNISGAMKWGGGAVLIISAIWTFLNLRDGSGGGAQLTASIVGMVGGAGVMGLAFFFDSLDTSFAG